MSTPKSKSPLSRRSETIPPSPLNILKSIRGHSSLVRFACLCDQPHRIRFAAADGNFTADLPRLAGEFAFRLFAKMDDLLGALAKEDARLRRVTLRLPRTEKRLTDLFFQFLHLAGKIRLRRVDEFRRFRDVFLSRHRQKIF